jgi:hypothetical protein
VWGERHYFYDCHRDGGDYTWFANNLNSAEGSPDPEEITARWTFDGQWDPEANMPPVLPFAFLPQPRDGARAIPGKGVRLSWVPARNAQSYNLYFGTENPPPFLKNEARSASLVLHLRPRTRYFWRVDTVTASGIVPGKVWHFETE